MRRGVNLIEVLVASAILAAVFLPLFGMFRSGVRTTQSTEDRLRALTIAQEQIQSIRHACGINRLAVESLVRPFALSPGFRDYTVDDRYKVHTVVDPDYEVEYGTLTAIVTRVEVTVDWELSGKARQLRVATLLDRAYE